jgi:two-component system chemotaxis sensor kinase CheA
MDLTSFYSQFRDETVENLRILSEGLMALETAEEGTPTYRQQIDTIFRAMHTIKGSARLLGFNDVGSIAHTCEHILGAVREGQYPITRVIADEIMRGGDVILDLINAIVEGQSVQVDVAALIERIEKSTQTDKPEAETAIAPTTDPAPSTTEETDQAQPEDQAEADEAPASAPKGPVLLKPLPSRVAATPAEATPATPEPAPAAPATPPAPAAPATPAASAPAPKPASTPAPAPAANAPTNLAPGTKASVRQTIRVRVDRLDRLLNLAGELAVGRQSHLSHLQALETLQNLIQQEERLLIALEDELQRLRFSSSQRELLDRHINGLLNNGEQAGRIIKSEFERFEQYTNNSGQLIEQLEQEVMAARLLPVSTLFANLPRAVRDLTRDIGKEVNLVLLGESTELDRKVIEALNDPLIHMIRNAVDHGIEPPDEREALGKPRQGQIEVAAESFGGYAHVTITDDGRGLNAQQLREAAVRKNLLSNDAAMALTDQEALELIFLPGFSTARMITDISGRGVGMDVVRTNLSEIGGNVLVESQIGVGTKMTLVLPLTLVTTRVLLVEIGEHMFALPASGCRGSVWAYPDRVRAIEGRAMLPYEGHLAPILRLADLLDIGGALPFPAQHRTPTVIIGTNQRPLALLIDRLVDEREVVVKPLGPLLEQQRRFSGAIQLGDGRLVLLLNPAIIAQTARGMALARPSQNQRTAARRSRLLVADDSFTTRELIRSILQSAGYEVTTAVDGLDALDKLRAAPYDLVVSDVEMPRVDGFQLTYQIRQELGLDDLPVVIITSLASETHRRRGLEVGAQAYIVKSQFDQGNLLDTVQRLLGG